jgi:SAM-dependent methyltransferase
MEMRADKVEGTRWAPPKDKGADTSAAVSSFQAAIETLREAKQSAAQLLTFVKTYTPTPIRVMAHRLQREIRWQRDRRTPVREVFRNVYAKHGWGRGHTDGFYSGMGSDVILARAYADNIRQYIEREGIRSIVDLGCGDYRVASLLVSDDVQYVGMDIVEEVISANRERHTGPNVRFQCLDIIRDPLPAGDLCLIREVFQHLSNAEILRVLPKLRDYKHVIFSDAQLPRSAIKKPNRDIAHGRDTRVWKYSALFLDLPPFNVPTKLLFETEAPQYVLQRGERICTYRIWP